MFNGNNAPTENRQTAKKIANTNVIITIVMKI